MYSGLCLLRKTRAVQARGTAFILIERWDVERNLTVLTGGNFTISGQSTD